MVVISQALETAIAIIIFVGLVLLFFSVLGSPECDKFANQTAVELTETINKVAMENGVVEWSGSGVPPDDDIEQYAIVQIRLCEKNRIETLAAAFMAQVPTYIITYETFPEEGFAWSESQPFSGGAMESVLNYAVMKYGAKGFFFAGKLITKVIKGTITGIIKFGFKGFFGLKWAKFRQAVDKIKNNWLVRKFLGRSAASAAQKSLSENIDEMYGLKYLPKKFKGLAEDFKKYLMVNPAIQFEEFLMKENLIESTVDRYGKRVAKQLGDYQYVVTQKGRDFVSNIVELSPAKDTFQKLFYIPSKWDRWESFKINKWFPFKLKAAMWWQNNRFNKYVIQTPKNLYNKIKEKFNSVFNNQAYLNDYNFPQKTGVVKKFVMQNRGELRQQMINNWGGFKGPLEEITGKVFNNPNEVWDTDLIKLVNGYDRYFNSNMFYAFGKIGANPVTHASETLASLMKTDAEAVREGTMTFTEFMNRYPDWNNMGTLEQDAKLLEMMKGHGDPLLLQRSQAKIIYDDLRAHLSKETQGYSTTSFNRLVLGSELVDKADKVKAKSYSLTFRRMEFANYYERLNTVPDFYFKPIATESFLSSLKGMPNCDLPSVAGSEVCKRLARGVLFDMNRIGQGPLAPYNVLSSPYDLKEGLKKASEIKEDGCYKNSLCMIQRGITEGPSETSSAYLLDRSLNENITVKLWRPKPSLAERTPIGISTALFYASVAENPRFHVISPCFATAKIWKKGDTVFVDINKGKKCDVSGCEQPNLQFQTPWLGPIPPLPISAGFSSVDTPNYCYADEEYIWGEDLSKWGHDALLTTGDTPSEIAYFGGYGACVAACSLLTSGAGTQTCLKGCYYGTFGVLTAHTLGATQAYRDVPSWKRQETSWGYWNYQKAGDICDDLEMLSSFGVPTKAATSIQKLVKKVPTKITEASKKVVTKLSQKASGWLKRNTLSITDLCYGLVLIGDTSLSWPIKVPVGEVWKRGAVLNEQCMKDSAANCIFLEKCYTNDDCPDGQVCVGSTCRA